ncbi:L-rhamnose mutarotase [Mesorhizobium sp. M0701]|uniref:L-rhamnose mutarotase n=1 Tax=Mesorhizobium sp. M0701 TaxID=2956989 RepID=UPI00333B3006
MKRMGMMIGIRADQIEEYNRIHAAIWPEVAAVISACNITNYTIFLKQPENILFGYWEYVGEDYSADSAKLAASPAMKRWWAVTDPMQEPVATRKGGEWWAMMEENFHMD